MVTFNAANNILQYKKNGNYVRAWLVGLTNISATIKILCKQLQDTPKYIEVLRAVWTDGVPSTENYMLTDSDYTAPVSFSGEYELNPDVLIIMQKAPAVYKDGTKLPVGLEFVDGHNVAVSKMDNGVLLYGAAGAGRDGVYEMDPLGVCFVVVGIVDVLDWGQTIVSLANIVFQVLTLVADDDDDSLQI